MPQPVDPLPQVAQSEGYGRRYPHRGHYFLNCGIALAAFAFACLLLHRCLPFPEIAEVTAKLDYFKQHKDDFDTVFIGSSRIHHHIIPEVFDRAAAKNGVPVRSFNLGVGGMHPPESLYVLEQVLRTKPAHLRWVFLELEELFPNFSKEKLSNRRFIYWHTWQLTRLAVWKSLNADGRQPWHRILRRALRSDTARTHVAVFIKNFANVGAAKDVLDSLRTRKSRASSSTWQNLEHDHGYWPSFRPMTPDEVNQFRAKADAGIFEDEDYTPSGEPMGPAETEQYRARLQSLAREARPHLVDLGTDAAYIRHADKVRAAGAKLFCVVPAGSNLKQFRFRGGGAAPEIFAFNDTGKYAALYDPRVRVDQTHMTEAGANLLSTMLAEQFASRVGLSK